MGCRQITPQLVGLAERLQDKPFHLIASHAQDTSSKKEVVAYARANGLAPHAPNFTITKSGRHPDVRGNGYVPYSLVFDHRGRLAYHHMSGSYHGGDGWTMSEKVEALVKETPVVYLGEEPFEKARALAEKVSAGRGLAAAVKTIESQLETTDDPLLKAELERLDAAVARHRDRGIRRAEFLVGTQPREVVPRLRQLLKDLKGTRKAEAVASRIESWEASEDLATAITIQRKFERAVRSFEKLREKQRTEVVVARTVKKLEELIEGHEDLPIAATVEAYLADLR